MGTLGVSLAVLTAVLMVCVRASPTVSLVEMALEHQVILSKDLDFTLSWTPREKDVIFEISAETTGYIAIGFSPSGRMEGSDIIIGWVDDATGEAIVHDRYATGYTVPSIDKSQDVVVHSGHQNSTHTVLRFSRPWNTCDKDRDFTLSNDTVRVIWAFNHADPTGEMTMLRHQKRGTKSMMLTEPPFTMPQLGDDVMTWDLVADNISLPDTLDTMYWCQIFKIPPLTRKTHLIGYVPVINEESAEHVHHLVLYECKMSESEKYLEHWLGVKGSQCYSPNMPRSWLRCSSPIIIWAVGSNGEMLPEHVGFPIGEEHGGATYFMMEVHYDNPNLRQNVRDSSGIRVFYTEKLRKYDGANIDIGHVVSPLMVIPPNKQWDVLGHCTSECTRETLPPEGINIFQGVLHSHVLGKSMRLRQIRDGKELPTALKDMAYDFDFQQSRVLSKEMKILPGDSLIMECHFDSTGKKSPSFGGISTNEEMCIAFVSYYPRIDLAKCSSSPSMEVIYKSVGFDEIYSNKGKKFLDRRKNVNEVEERQRAEKMKSSDYEDEYVPINLSRVFGGIKAKSPAKYQDRTLLDVFNDDSTWQDLEMLERLQNATLYGEHMVLCKDKLVDKQFKIPGKTGYPTFTPIQETDVCDLQ